MKNLINYQTDQALCFVQILKLLSILSLVFALFIWDSVAKTHPAIKTIKIASFNIKWLSHKKASDRFKGKVIIDILYEFDLIAIQEIRDKTNKTMDILVSALNEKGKNYDFILGPRLPHTGSNYKERYAFIYNTYKIENLGLQFTFSDPYDKFEREPLVAKFKAKMGNFDFILVNIHTKPSDAEEEIKALKNVIFKAASVLGEPDVITLGDFNADCAKGDDYYDESKLKTHFPSAGFIVAIPNTADTNLASTECTYDRIILTNSLKQDFIPARWGVYKFDEVFDLTYDEAKSVSDHYPVWTEYYTNKDTD